MTGSKPIEKDSREDVPEYQEGQKWLHRDNLQNEILNFQSLQRGLEDHIVYPTLITVNVSLT